MNTTFTIILAIGVIGGIFLLKGLTSNPKGNNISVEDTTKRPVRSMEEATKLVQRLEELGYYKYTDPKDLDTLRKDLIESLSAYDVLSTVFNLRTFIPLDNRLFLFDGETLFEEGGFMDAIERMRPLFAKMNFRVDITDHLETGDNHMVNHRMTINGKPYIIFANFEAYGWGEAAQRFAEIMNDQLKLQNKQERLYLVNGGNDGQSVYLTDEQYQVIDSALTDDLWKPLPVDKWCKVFEVDPNNYNKNLRQQ